MHLTNNAIQKYSKSYGKFEEANIVSVGELCDELQIAKSDVYSMIESQIVESIISVRHHLKFHSHTFELIGYDFMMI